MSDKSKKETKKSVNKSGAEKPVSLWGASFQEVLKAILKTKPINDAKDKRESNAKTK